MEDINSPEKKKCQKSARKAGSVSAILGVVSQLFSTLVRTVTSSTQTSVSSQNLPTSIPSGTPKISFLFKGSNNIKVGYFIKLEFLDNQADFYEVFGDKPKILAPNIIMSQNSPSADIRLYSFG